MGIRIEDGNGILLIIPDQYDFDSAGNRITKKGGMAAQFSTSATAHFGDEQQVSVSEVNVKINNTDYAINQSYLLGSAAHSISLVAGPFIEVEAKGISVTLGGQEISGDFAFVRSTNSETKVTTTRVRVTNALVSIATSGRELVRATSTEGMQSFLEIRPGSMVGVLNVDTIIDVPGVKLSGSFGARFNSCLLYTSDAADE